MKILCLNTNTKPYLLGTLSLILCLSLQFNLIGQTWSALYNLEDEDLCYTVVAFPSGDFAFIGSKIIRTNSFGDTLWSIDLSPNMTVIGEFGSRKALAVGEELVVMGRGGVDQIILAKFNSNGLLTWEKTHVDLPFSSDYMQLAGTNSGGFAIGGSFHDDLSESFKVGLLVTDSEGEEINRFQDGSYINDLRIKEFEALSNNTYAFAGQLGLDAILIVVDENGNILWEKTPNPIAALFAQAKSITESTDGQIVLAGEAANSSGLNQVYFFTTKYDFDGNESWSHAYEERKEAFPEDIIVSTTGGYLIVGWQGSIGNGADGLILKIDEDGNKEWDRRYSEFLDDEVLKSVKNTIAGGYIIGGISKGFIPSNTSDILGWKIDAAGNISPALITGKVFFDNNSQNCELELEEPGLSNWVVEAIGNDTKYYAVTDEQGNFKIEVPPGDFEVSVTPPNYWLACPPIPLEIALQDTLEVLIGVYNDVSCPLMTVDISTPFLRLCSEGRYGIAYCNNGTLLADDATVEVTLPPELTYLDATANLLSQNGQTLVFDIGDVDVNECGSFQLHYEMVCDTNLFGQTLCTEAHIYPDEACNSLWMGPLIEAKAECVNDSVFFTIKNVGGDMPEAQNSIIIVDNIILMHLDFQLPSLDSLVIAPTNQNGNAYHIVAGQNPNLPEIYGHSIATASTQGCSVPPSTPSSFSAIPEDDGESWFSIDCQEVISSYDPNDKNASPIGWTEERFIEADTDLEYHIRFQNTGTDTAFNIVIVDTLSQWLDPGSIRPGASSHSYVMEMEGENEIRFRFSNIQLPDSTTNEGASHGFVKFKISQVPGNEPGTYIENRAAIYFDFNAPVITNTIWHTVRKNWLTGLTIISEPTNGVNVYPNPFREKTTFEIEGELNGELFLTLFDVSGKKIKHKKFQGKTVELYKTNLQPGMYFFKIDGHNTNIGNGKLIVF